jgi:hypothetical protein
MFVGQARRIRSGASLGYTLALVTSNRLRWKGLTGTITLAYDELL